MGHNFQLLLSTLSPLARRTSVLTVGARRHSEFLRVLRYVASSSRRASWLFIAATACRVASLQASDLQCSFFVARESKRLQASGFAAGDCRQMLLYVYRCFERARLRLKSPLVDKRAWRASATRPAWSTGSPTSLAAVPRPRAYSNIGSFRATRLTLERAAAARSAGTTICV